ncbi:MAG: hypothetical protein C6W55_06010 [Thermobacillus sp.]|uniref:zinc-dependent alcohol dehydrogenase n=1 Tax=Thermobacillus sp. TaxID=2108467 RepID=UPI000E397F69|nr:zinc-binding dehydrogenase [Thermobacillus sp.]REK57303.1 MAG: hypothetical protein C6W55_06010 [Thermobacillus sp.]
MRQIRAFGPQDLRMVEAEDPVPGAGEVVVDVMACGICGSDKWFWYVEGPHSYVAGHEAAGVVSAVGPGVRELRVGDRVAVNNVRGCGECEACREEAYVRCTGGLSHMGFGFSEKIAVPERNCLKLHDAISFEQGALIFDNWGTPYSALARTNLKAGDTVLVTGCGPIGLAAVGLCRQHGARVAAVDVLPARLAAAKRQGAEWTGAPGDGLADELLRFAGEDGFDCVVECSGHPSSYDLGFEVIGMGGTIVVVGEKAEIRVNSSRIIHKHLTITGSLYSTMPAGRAVQELMVRGEIDPMAFVTHMFRLEELPEKFGDVIEAKDGLIKAIVVR